MRLFNRTTTIDARTAAEQIEVKNAVVVDVRQSAEWKAGHIHSAIHIPLTQLSNRLQQIPSRKTIVTACASGHRSSVAARTLTNAGHDVLNLRGAMKAWTQAGLPLDLGHRKR